MSVKIYHNPRCSKSRNTLNLIQEKGIEPEIIEYLKTPPTEKEIKQILSMLGIQARDLLRKNEDEFKQAGLDNSSLSEEEIIAAMHRFPKLIERPIVVADDKAVIGRPPENVEKIL